MHRADLHETDIGVQCMHAKEICKLPRGRRRKKDRSTESLQVQTLAKKWRPDRGQRELFYLLDVDAEVSEVVRQQGVEDAVVFVRRVRVDIRCVRRDRAELDDQRILLSCILKTVEKKVQADSAYSTRKSREKLQKVLHAVTLQKSPSLANRSPPTYNAYRYTTSINCIHASPDAFSTYCIPADRMERPDRYIRIHSGRERTLCSVQRLAS